jgi:hypothetical protein
MSTATAFGTVTVTHYDSNGTWLIALEGDHDMSTTPLLEQRTSNVWPHCTLAVVDLGEATFIDCSTIGWLLRTRGVLMRPGSDVLRIVQGPSGGAAARMFDLLRPDDVFACYPTRLDALAQTAAIPDNGVDDSGATRPPEG